MTERTRSSCIYHRCSWRMSIVRHRRSRLRLGSRLRELARSLWRRYILPLSLPSHPLLHLCLRPAQEVHVFASAGLDLADVLVLSLNIPNIPSHHCAIFNLQMKHPSLLSPSERITLLSSRVQASSSHSAQIASLSLVILWTRPDSEVQQQRD